MSIFARIGVNNEAVEYPLFEATMVERFPTLETPLNYDSVLPEGYVAVFARDRSYFQWDQSYVEIMPTQEEDGKWYQTFNITPLDEQQRQATLNAIAMGAREKRNTLLLLSDWTQLVDSPLTAEKKAEFVSYRQALRDISAQENFPINITWPQLP